MKRIFAAVFIASFCLISVPAENPPAAVDVTRPAEEINLGTFPIGSWLDDKWNGTWEFSSNDIKLYKNGELVYDFNGKITGFTVKAGTSGITVSFSCAETKRDYVFTKDLSLNKDISLVINNHATGEHYEKGLTYSK